MILLLCNFIIFSRFLSLKVKNTFKAILVFFQPEQQLMPWGQQPPNSRADYQCSTGESPYNQNLILGKKDLIKLLIFALKINI